MSTVLQGVRLTDDQEEFVSARAKAFGGNVSAVLVSLIDMAYEAARTQGGRVEAGSVRSSRKRHYRKFRLTSGRVNKLAFLASTMNRPTSDVVSHLVTIARMAHARAYGE